MSALRASSLAAVTILVWSTSENLSSCVSLRTCCLASTMSCSERSGAWPLAFGVIGSVRGYLPAQQRHAAFDVQRGRDAGQRQAELDQRDRDGRLHAHENRLRAEDARDAGDVGDHAADERVHHLERRDVDEDALARVLLDGVR